MIDLATLDGLTGGRLGRSDVACPLCGPQRKSPHNRVRKVLRVWRIDEGFATFHCARCPAEGHTKDPTAPPPDREKLAAARREAEALALAEADERLAKARRLWSKWRPIAGTIAETYLRECRGYSGVIPATLGFLPAWNEYPPAMIGAFGLAFECLGGLMAGQLVIPPGDVMGVHLTKLAPDGRAKAGTDRDKIMRGCPNGSPLVLAPVNDLCGLVIAEGIEDALSAHEATGLGAWAAGSASMLPALAAALPAYIESVSLLVDPDPAGRRNMDLLAAALAVRRIETRKISFEPQARAA